VGLSYTYDGSALGFDVPPTKATLTSRAELGSISTGGVSPEDPTAALALVGWKSFHVDESDCSQTRLFTGWVADRNIGRSFDQSQFVGPDPRIHDTNICELNAALSMRLIWDTDGKRPAEYLSTRVAWLLGSSYLTGLLDDTGKVAAFGSTDMMDAADYRGQFPDAVLGECNDRTGGVLNYFAFWDPTPASGSPRAALFFDTLDAATYDCTISISNAGDDNGTTIFEPDHPARLQRTPESIYSDVIVNYANGKSVHVYAAATATNFIRRGTTINRPHTGQSTTAIAQGTAWLNAHSSEVDRITTTIHVPSSVVGLIQAGMRMTCTFTHMPGYESGASMRIVACAPAPVDDLADWYDVSLELVAPKLTPSGCAGATPSAYYPQIGTVGGACSDSQKAQTPADGTIVYWYAGSAVPIVPSPGWCGVWHFPTWDIAGGGSPSGSMDASGAANSNAVRMLVVGGGTATIYVTGGWNSSGGRTALVDLYVQHADPANPTTIITDSSQIGISTMTDTVLTATVPGISSGVCDHWIDVKWRGANGGAGVGYAGFTWLADSSTTGGDILPGPLGSTVTAETPTPTPTGTTTTFTLASSYLPGTLVVTVDGIVIPSSEVTETDPVAGTFTLSWAPDADEKITVNYLVG
jgi:hypothetical protein